MNKILCTTVYTGLSGLQLDIPKYQFPPAYENKSRLTYYSSLFNSIEINSSFYKVPQAVTVAKWASSVNDDFRFTFKLWRQITHNKDLSFREEDVHTYFKSINSIKGKKGCLLIQLPPSLDAVNIRQLNKLLTCIRNIQTTQYWNIAVEFRNKSWYKKPVFALLNSYKAAVVIHDIPKSATPLINHQSDFIYIRFHGPTGNYRDSYSADFLNEYATYIGEWRREGKRVFVYFNNTMGDAFKNLKSLNKILHSEINIL